MERTVIHDYYELCEIWDDSLENYEEKYNSERDVDIIDFFSRSYKAVKKESVPVRLIALPIVSVSRLGDNSYSQRAHQLMKRIDSLKEKFDFQKLEFESDQNELVEIVELINSLELSDKHQKKIRNSWNVDTKKYLNLSVPHSLRSIAEKKEQELCYIGSIIDWNTRSSYKGKSKLLKEYGFNADISMEYFVYDLGKSCFDYIFGVYDRIGSLEMRNSNSSSIDDLIASYERNISTISEIRNKIRKKAEKSDDFLVTTDKTLDKIQKSLKEQLRILEERKEKLDSLERKKNNRNGNTPVSPVQEEVVESVPFHIVVEDNGRSQKIAELEEEIRILYKKQEELAKHKEFSKYGHGWDKEHGIPNIEVHEYYPKEYYENKAKIEALRKQIEAIKKSYEEERERLREEEKARIERYRTAVREAQERYESQSIFKRAIQSIRGKSPNRVLSNTDLTVEEIEGMYRDGKAKSI